MCATCDMNSLHHEIPKKYEIYDGLNLPRSYFHLTPLNYFTGGRGVIIVSFIKIRSKCTSTNHNSYTSPSFLLPPSSCPLPPAPFLLPPSSCSLLLPSPLARHPSLSGPPATTSSPLAAQPRLAILIQASLYEWDGTVPVLGGSGKIYFEGFLFSQY